MIITLDKIRRRCKALGIDPPDKHWCERFRFFYGCGEFPERYYIDTRCINEIKTFIASGLLEGLLGFAIFGNHIHIPNCTEMVGLDTDINGSKTLLTATNVKRCRRILELFFGEEV